jgi:hypothetical protein
MDRRVLEVAITLHVNVLDHASEGKKNDALHFPSHTPQPQLTFQNLHFIVPQCHESQVPKSTFVHLPRMLHNLADHLAVLNVTPHLFWHGVLYKVILGGHVDVDAGALAGKDFGVERFL